MNTVQSIQLFLRDFERRVSEVGLRGVPADDVVTYAVYRAALNIRLTAEVPVCTLDIPDDAITLESGENKDGESV